MFSGQQEQQEDSKKGSLSNLPVDILKLIIRCTNKEMQFQFLYINNFFHTFSKLSLKEGVVGTSPLSQIEKPRIPSLFFLRVQPPKISFPRTAQRITCITELTKGCFVFGNSNGSLSILSADQEIVTKQAYQGVFSNPSVIATNKLDDNSWTTLSEDGLLCIWRKKKEVELLKQRQLNIKDKVTSNCVACFDNGEIAVVALGPSGHYTAYFVSINEDITVTEVGCDPTISKNGHKINKVSASQAAEVIYISAVRQDSLAHLPVLTFIGKDGTIATKQIEYWGESDGDEHNYGISKSSSFCGYPLNAITQKQGIVAFGFDLVSPNPIGINEKATYRLYSIVMWKGAQHELQIVNTKKQFTFNEHSFVRILPNNCLFIKAGTTWAICNFEFRNSNRVDRSLSTVLTKIYSIDRPQEEKSPIDTFHVTSSGDLIISCDNKLFQWSLAGNELVVINTNINQDETILIKTDSNSSRSPNKRS